MPTISCLPEDLISGAECIDACIPPGMQQAILISIFCNMATLTCTPEELIDGAACIDNCIPPGMRESVLIHLACQIVNNGGGDTPVSTTKVFRAIIAQSGTNAPTNAFILENTLGGTPVWSYAGVGRYTLTLAGAFPANKTMPTGSPDEWNGNGQIFIAGVIDNDSIRYHCYSNANTSEEIGSGFVEILVYP